jgi:hypothetical protein
LNTKLNNFYVLANNIFDNNNSFSDVGHLGENMRLIRENILGINNLILSKEGEVIDSIIKNRNLAEDSFSDLKISLQKTHSFFDIVGNVFGEKQKTKTLIFFQNPRNINASGGK